MSSKPATKKAGKTLDDLRALHDRSVLIPNRIKATIEKLAEVSWQEWAYESDFLSISTPRISTKDLSDFRDRFKDFWAEMPPTNGRRDARKVWFATKKAADDWRKGK